MPTLSLDITYHRVDFGRYSQVGNCYMQFLSDRAPVLENFHCRYRNDG